MVTQHSLGRTSGKSSLFSPSCRAYRCVRLATHICVHCIFGDFSPLRDVMWRQPDQANKNYFDHNFDHHKNYSIFFQVVLETLLMYWRIGPTKTKQQHASQKSRTNWKTIVKMFLRSILEQDYLALTNNCNNLILKHIIPNWNTVFCLCIQVYRVNDFLHAPPLSQWTINIHPPQVACAVLYRAERTNS